MASGDTLDTIFPSRGILPSSNFMTFDLRGTHLVLDADGASDESVYFPCVMPEHYGGGGLTIDVYWTCDDVGNGTTDDVDIDIAIERLNEGAQDIDSDGFAAANSDDGTLTPTTSGEIQKSTVTFTDGADMDSVAAGDPFRLKLTRDGTNDAEDGDIQILFVHIKET